MKKLFFIPIACLMFMACNGQSAEKVDLKYNLQQGQDYPMTMSSVMKMKQSMAALGMDLDIDMNMDMSINCRVDSIVDGLYYMDVRYSRVKMEMKSPMFSMTVDTDNVTEDDMMGRVFSGLTKGSFKMVMTDKGKVTEINGIDEWILAMANEIPELTGMEKEQILAQVQQSYGEDSFKQNFEQMVSVYPDELVGPGSKWNTTMTMTSPVAFTMNNEYTYVKDEGDNRIVNLVSTINPIEGDSHVSGEVRSEMKIDKNSGWATSGNLTQKMDMTMSVPAGNGENMETSMKIESTTTFNTL